MALNSNWIFNLFLPQPEFNILVNFIWIATIYRCQYDGGEIMNFLRKSGTSIEIDSEDMEYECNVLFLWTRKNKTVVDNVKRRTTDLMDMNSSLG